MRFRTTVELGGKTATGLPVPAEVVEALGQGKRPPVHVTVAGHHYRSTVAPMGGRYFVPLSAEHRSAAGVAAGDEVDVDIEVDTEPREVAVPADLVTALDGNTVARQCFDGLSYSRRRRFVLDVEGARTAETRQRRIAKALTTLSAG